MAPPDFGHDRRWTRRADDEIFMVQNENGASQMRSAVLISGAA
jgi:hypothetical protein